MQASTTEFVILQHEKQFHEDYIKDIFWVRRCLD